MEVPVLKPYALSDFDQLFSLNKTSIWASFSPPPNYYSTAKLFSYQIVPSLGGEDKQEADMDKLEHLGDALSKDQDQQHQGQGQDQEEPSASGTCSMSPSL